jgi:tetratricopeptide (TPR) repeat protein
MSSHNQISQLVGKTVLAVLLSLALPILASAQVKKAPVKSDASTSHLAAAQKQLSQGDVQGAEATVWQVLSVNPNDKQALTLLAAIRVKQQQFQEAESLLRRVILLDPKAIDPHVSLSDVLLAQQKLDDAVAEYETAEQLEPGNIELKANFARLLLIKGDSERSLAILNQIPAARFPETGIPIKAAALLSLGKTTEVFLRGGLPDQSLRMLKDIPPPAKGFPFEYYYLMGQIQLALNHPDQAQISLRKASILDPKSVEALMALAESSAMQGKHADSVAALQKAHDLVPKAVPVLHYLVIEAEASGQHAVALGAARQLIQESPDDLDNIFLASAAMLQANDSISALSALKGYTSKRPEDPKGWLALGMSHVIQKNYPQAREALERSAKIAPNQAETEYQLGVLSDAETKQDEAIAHFERVLQLQPNHAKALGKIGSLYLQQGNLPKAEDALKRSSAADSSNPDTEYKLAMVLGKMGKPDEAREHMRRFQELKNAGRSTSTAAKPETKDGG